MSHVGSRVDEDNGGVASPEALGFGGQDDEDIQGLVPEPEVLSNFSFLPDSSEFLQVLDFLSEEAEPNDVSSSAAREPKKKSNIYAIHRRILQKSGSYESFDLSSQVINL